MSTSKTTQANKSVKKPRAKAISHVRRERGSDVFQTLRDMAISYQLKPGERLSEIDFGEWEGRPWDDIDRTALDAWAADVLHFVPPRGESVAQLQARALDFAESLDLPAVALVAHAGILRALVGHWQRLPADEWTRLQFEFGGLTELTC